MKFAYGSMAKALAANVAIGRICRAVRQGPSTDGVIDLAIALECLVEAQVEIKFQFALFNALMAEDSLNERSEVFSLLQKLYDMRSLGVHGARYTRADKRKMAELKANWDRIVSIARRNLTYYLVYCRNNGHDDWSKHLRSLAFGGARLTLDSIHD